MIIKGPSRARHSSSKDTPDSISHNSELATPVSAKDRPISMHELGSASVLATSRTTPSYESSKLRPSERPIRQAETINPPGEAVRQLLPTLIDVLNDWAAEEKEKYRRTGKKKRIKS